MKKGDNVINNLEIKRISIINNQELTEAFTFIADESLDYYLKTYMDTTTILADDYIKKEFFLEIRRDYFLHKNSAIYTAKVEGVLVGAALRCNSYLDSLFVKKEYRNQKVGSTLLEKVLNDCKEYQVIRLNANIKAISLYQRYGFCQNGQIEKNLIVPMVLERKKYGQ